MTIRVLVVDDDPDIVRLLKIKLSRAGYEVITAQDGAAGIETAQEESPDVVVTGFLLPKVDGLEVARRLKSEMDPAPQVLVLSIRDQAEDIAACFAAGADDFISKPFSPYVVIERIMIALIRSGKPVVQQGSNLHV